MSRMKRYGESGHPCLIPAFCFLYCVVCSMTILFVVFSDGKILLVDSDGNGPHRPLMMRTGKTSLRLPSEEEVNAMGIRWTLKNRFDIRGTEVLKGHPEIEWPKEIFKSLAKIKIILYG